MDVRLVMFLDDGERRDFPLTKERTTVGRTVDCDLRVPLSSVSRRQCELIMEGNALVLRDLGSSNGTYHNNTRVQEVTVEPGDEIKVGPVVFTVVIDGKPEKITPSTESDDDAVAAWIEEEEDEALPAGVTVEDDIETDPLTDDDDDDGMMTIQEMDDDSPTVIEDLDEKPAGPPAVVEAPPAARPSPSVKASNDQSSKNKSTSDSDPLDDDDFADLLLDGDGEEEDEDDDPIVALESLADELADEDSKAG